MSELTAQTLSHPRLSSVLLVLVMGSAPVLPCSAQSAANLYGTVTDAGKAAISGANVTVTDVATSVVTKTTTDGSGNYSFPSLAPAGYSITVEAPGFKTEDIQGIVLSVNQKARQDVTLQVGSVDTKVRQRIVVNTVYDLLFGNGRRFLNQKGILNAIVGGWEVSQITSYQTGYPFTVLGPDFSSTSSSSPRPNRSCSGVGQKSVTNWFRQNCFSAAGSAAVPTFGNSRRNILDAPGLSNTDLAVLRHFNVADKADIEFRSELFDAFNTPYFAPPGNNISGENYKR